MKIVIDAREYPTSTGRYIRKLLEYLEKIDANSARQYVILLKSADLDSYQPSASNFQKKAADFKEFSFSEQIGFLRFIRSLKADLVHFGKTEQPVLYFGKTITTIHDLTTVRFYNPTKNWVVFKIKQFIYALVVKIVARKSNRVIAISQYVKDDVSNFTGVKKSKITVTLEAGDKITSPSQVVKDLRGHDYIMYVGRPMEHKNLRRLIDAYALLKSLHPGLELVLVGQRDPLYDKHLSYAQTNGITGVVTTGFMSEGQLRWLYENCRAYIFPSLSEGFGLPPLEAMAHGAPVVSSNATCLPEINGDAAHYFNPYSIDDMAEKIHEVLTSEELRSTLIKKGFVQVKKYSWEKMAQQTLALYKRLLSM